MKRIRTMKTTLIVAALMTAGAGFASANDPGGDDLSLSDLLNIKLSTGSFLELDLAKSPLSMTIIDKNKVELSGARDLSELLEVYVPGFAYMYNRWNGKIWAMRGVTNDRNTKILVLVNGHKMNTEARDGFFQETALGLLGDIERVEVLRGPAGLVYGSGAIAGIVNIVTRKAGDATSDVRVRAGAWSSFVNNSTSFQGVVSGKAGEGADVMATLGYEKSTGVGNGVSRLYGRPGWPYPGWVSPEQSPKSVPADGSAQETPGNWKASVDYNINGLRVYGRFTHQVQEAGGLFMYQPWPQREQSVVSTKDSLKAAFIDGKSVNSTDPFWSQVNTNGESRREYVADNITIEASYDLPLGDNTLKMYVGLDGNSNQIRRQMRPGYDGITSTDKSPFLEEAFGERRYTIGANYLMKNIPSLQLAVGAEQRLDDIGEDLFGHNFENQLPGKIAVANILYSNTAVFTEGWYDLMPNLGFDFGLRWDGHTRTIDNGGTFNGKFATVWTPVQGHTIKAIFQSSSNNASADNYEYGRNNYNDDGTLNSTYHFYTPTFTAPDSSGVVIVPGVSESDLHKLKPEKVYSFELTSTHELGYGLSLSPSVSYNMIRDLFAWSQPLIRVVNVGQYDNLNIDVEAGWKTKYVDVGMNHAIQWVMNTDVAEQGTTIYGPAFAFTDTTGGVKKARTDWYAYDAATGQYIPTPNVLATTTLNPVASQITVDGDNFMSIPTHITKFWADVKPVKGLTFHTDVRVFWGLLGQDDAMKADAALGYNNMDLNANPITKWNASLHADLANNWSVGVFVCDILSGTSGDLLPNSIRWQNTYDASARDLYSVDFRSYAMELKKSF